MIKRFVSIPAAVLTAMLLASAAHAQQDVPLPLETVLNFQRVGDRLASSGQIGLDQISLIKDEGYEVVINLAVADPRNEGEGFAVAEARLTYVHIPVVWETPTVSDVEMFLDVMQANRNRKVYVHCIANMRASAFMYMYRTLIEGVPEPEARATMNAVWDPDDREQWGDLVRQVMSEPRR